LASVVVVGLGYIGLPTAAMLALNGNDVYGVDIALQTVEALRNGNVPVRERDLTAIVRDAIRTGRLRVSDKPRKADYLILCVPTPKKDHRPDLSALRSASRAVAEYVAEGSTVIVESTVPPGTCSNVVRPIIEAEGRRAGKDFHLAYCPERVMPGNIIREIVENDRIIGGLTSKCGELARKLYTTFVRGQIHLTDLVTAEFVKLAENAFRDVNIAFANELADLAEAHGIDVWQAIELANKHPRVSILRPGPGVGGHCIAVDPWFLLTPKTTSRMIPAARLTNDLRPETVARKTLEFSGHLKKPKVAVLGVAYKGNADDIRESPAIKVIEMLQEKGVALAPYDPLVPQDTYPTLQFEDAIDGADCILILADHREFYYIDPVVVARRVRKKLLFDTRNCVDHRLWSKAGFDVRLLGSFGIRHTDGLQSKSREWDRR